jgi:hypothetical protein
MPPFNVKSPLGMLAYDITSKFEKKKKKTSVQACK